MCFRHSRLGLARLGALCVSHFVGVLVFEGGSTGMACAWMGQGRGIAAGWKIQMLFGGECFFCASLCFNHGVEGIR